MASLALGSKINLLHPRRCFVACAQCSTLLFPIPENWDHFPVVNEFVVMSHSSGISFAALTFQFNCASCKGLVCTIGMHLGSNQRKWSNCVNVTLASDGSVEQQADMALFDGVVHAAVAAASDEDYDAEEWDEEYIDLSGYAVGTEVSLRVKGSRAAHCAWGGGPSSATRLQDKIYTFDSTLSVCAVHAGLIKSGETALVTVRILGEQPGYQGSHANGVTTESYEAYGPSFCFVKAEPAPAVTVPLPTLELSNQQVGDIVKVQVRGVLGCGSAWGGAGEGKLYTYDSNMNQAALHAGLVQIGETKELTVQIHGQQPQFFGSFANGVQTASYGAYGPSFCFVTDDHPAKAKEAIAEEAQTAAAATLQFSDVSLIGTVHQVTVTGSIRGSVWGGGSDERIYTADSCVATAAVHCGLLNEGETGTLIVTVTNGLQQYLGSKANGVTTAGYGRFSSSFVLSREQQSGDKSPVVLVKADWVIE